MSRWTRAAMKRMIAKRTMMKRIVGLIFVPNVDSIQEDMWILLGFGSEDDLILGRFQEITSSK